MSNYEELLNIVKTEKDLEEFLTHEDKYEYLYNFSNIRKNVLEWYDFNPKARLLELGAECGALTGLFCDRVKEVVAIDEDERKCAVNIARNAKKGNLKVRKHVESLEQKKKKADEQDGDIINGKYDYVTIIGNFSVDKLRIAKEFLKPKGRLLLAIENKYGIKYWSGDERPNTYSRMQLIGLLRMEGFKIEQGYYPIPDYVFPMEIYSSKNLPKVGSISTISPSFEKDKVLSLDEIKAYDMVIKDGKFEEYANSFIVIAELAGKN